ncbi:MAG: hypothetical protein HOJ77_04170, partial [Flavobacteriales bacterium]|nr:hypothetical protein [Flavobacteriales bacterium]
MSIKASLSLPFAKFIVTKNSKWKKNAVKVQQKLMFELIERAKKTKFGREHNFSEIRNYSNFKMQIPIRDYEGLKGYVNLIIDGEKDILWPGKP